MSRLTQSAGWLWKPVAAVALAALLASWADAAPPVAGGTSTGTTTATGGTSTTGGVTSTTPTDGPMAEIVALAQFLADEFDLTFSDPLEEAAFFFAVADLYFQVLKQQARAARHAAGGTRTGTNTRGVTGAGSSGTTALTPPTTFGSLTTVNR